MSSTALQRLFEKREIVGGKGSVGSDTERERCSGEEGYTGRIYTVEL